MAADTTRSPPGTEAGHRPDREWANEERPDNTAGGTPQAAKLRLARLARTIEADVIPRLVQAHRPAVAPPHLSLVTTASIDVEVFLRQIIDSSDTDVAHALARLRDGGVSVESLYLDLLAPTARRLGEMWEDDTADFSTVTIALGRLQRLLRELSPAFGTEIEHPTHGRRALFVQPRDEQHSFGLSMVAEFFRREGWDVIGGVGGAVASPATMVRDEWVDVVGFSVGSDGRLPWLQETVSAVRAASRNPGLVVLVGGPPFVAQPELAASAGADGTARNGKEAPQVAERLMARGLLRAR